MPYKDNENKQQVDEGTILEMGALCFVQTTKYSFPAVPNFSLPSPQPPGPLTRLFVLLGSNQAGNQMAFPCLPRQPTTAWLFRETLLPTSLPEWRDMFLFYS